MGHSQSDKAASHERILTEAAAQVRGAGLESVSVAKLMRSVNLTHGGFYGHFASRSELLAKALERALVDGSAASRAATPPAPSGTQASFDTLVRSYLSRQHRDARKSGCAIAALASDVARADDASREVMSEHIDRFVARLASALAAGTAHSTPAGAELDDQALFAASAMVGGLLLARVCPDSERSDRVLQAVRAGLSAATRPEPG